MERLQSLEDRVKSLDERLVRVEKDVGDFRKEYNTTILGTVKEPGLAQLVRETNAGVTRLASTVREMGTHVSSHTKYIFMFHGTVATIGAIYAVVRLLR